MKDDRTTPMRRALLRGAAALGVAASAGCFATDPARTPGRAATGAAATAPGAPAPGAPAIAPLKPSAYRLQPLTGYGPPARTRVVVKPAVRRAPILRIDSGGRRTMVLTFDDGPDPAYTPDILRVLREHRVPAVFFVCGEQVLWNKGLTRRMVDEGHLVGNHTWSHPLLPSLSRSAIRSEMLRTSEIVEHTVGTAPEWFRAPYGAWNRSVFQIGAELGMEPLAWNIDTLDWDTPGTAAITRSVRQGAGPGAVVLSHDAGGDRSQTVRALRIWLPELLAEGYEMVLPDRTVV
ncbi:polysaccharide deacetylase family protein [Streptomyces sp. NPDC005955]|uniref:polysaccharide deacetylase family protein n=1 Tax=Streptomyces sp. NPDC005955 TaxID=3364738 RepID=UPI00368533EE